MKDNTLMETTADVIDEAAFSEILQRVRGMITAPIYEAVPGRLTVHADEQLDFTANGHWVTAAMATNGRVICYNGHGKVEICDTVDEAVEAVNRLYKNAMAKSNFEVTVDVNKLHFLRLATPGENPEVTDGMGEVEMIEGNLMLFARNGNLSYANPDTHVWYEATICNEGIICTTSEGAFKLCTDVQDLIEFLYFSINPNKLRQIQKEAAEWSVQHDPIAACLQFCGL